MQQIYNPLKRYFSRELRSKLFQKLEFYKPQLGKIQRIKSVSESILFADHTGVIFSSINCEDFCTVSNLVLPGIIKWFAANILVLNLDKTNIIVFIKEELISFYTVVHIGYKRKL